MKEWTPNHAGGTVYQCLRECLLDLSCDNVNAYECTINEISIIVYKHSIIEDLCDKYDLQRKYQYGH